MTEEQQLVRILTQALKDIINASANDQPYSYPELVDSFGMAYATGYAYLAAHGIEEIA